MQCTLSIAIAQVFQIAEGSDPPAELGQKWFLGVGDPVARETEKKNFKKVLFCFLKYKLLFLRRD